MRCICGVLLLVVSAPPAAATVLLPADFTELVIEARAIVHGRVVHVRPAWAEGRRRIDSLVTVEVDRYFKGDLGREVVVRVPGGQVGPYRSVMVGAPVLEAGDEVVLLLGARGSSWPYILGLSQGLFRVVASARGKIVDPPLVGSGDRVPIVRGDPRRRAVALEEFGDRIAGILAARAAGRR